METIEPQIETTEDGSPTLRHPLLHDTYHSLRGAEGESRYIFIEQGLHEWVNRKRRALEERGNAEIGVQTSPVIRILEMGFGSGLNAWLTWQEARKEGWHLYYETLERYPVAETVAAQLAYAADPRFMALHRAPWDVEVPLDAHFTLKKRHCSLEDCTFETTFDLVYFDAFAPDTQPELWSFEVFSRLYDHLNDGGILVTYSAKGVVKEHLRQAGFVVKRLPGALGKRHMVRAEKPANQVDSENLVNPVNSTNPVNPLTVAACDGEK